MNNTAKSKRPRSTFSKDVRLRNKTEDTNLQQKLNLIDQGHANAHLKIEVSAHFCIKFQRRQLVSHDDSTGRAEDCMSFSSQAEIDCHFLQAADKKESSGVKESNAFDYATEANGYH
ncbi:hypothetical protein SKAU_G00208260 [Synaphobranchus kaupii]|uniref:Uncharacterized protein n=1 Tax=Synaphobranchus kaupii TaxID=118154 RepID=A0A9Q1F879_SYNKA|nr:hypothetical protein SKAU_G00208260 [Synaphobranchus kaupii]